ncbi:MAG: type II toxin-antitoxin system RelE/ParE family toxin [Bacteroidales bacterium]
MKIIQSRRFARKIKKFSKDQKPQLDLAILEILHNPVVGERKKGDLKDTFIHKFYIGNTLYLLAYSFSSDQLELIMIGPHENYYKDLKNYLKKR